MKNKTRMNLVIIAFINWSVALFVNDIYNYISVIILIVAIIYLLKNVKEMGYKWEPINFGKLFKSK
jgi:uncharacterized membrane protein YdbT with pleckstrin-like domain